MTLCMKMLERGLSSSTRDMALCGWTVGRTTTFRLLHIRSADACLNSLHVVLGMYGQLYRNASVLNYSSWLIRQSRTRQKCVRGFVARRDRGAERGDVSWSSPNFDWGRSMAPAHTKILGGNNSVGPCVVIPPATLSAPLMPGGSTATSFRPQNSVRCTARHHDGRVDGRKRR